MVLLPMVNGIEKTLGGLKIEYLNRKQGHKFLNYETLEFHI